MQRQFDTLCQLMRDPHPPVRVIAVEGVCRILAHFWELIPSAVIMAMMKSLVNDSAHDAASAAVRTSVFKGFTYILANQQHRSHSVLRAALPQLANLIHDRSRSVRLAFCDLLLQVKAVKGIRFYKVALSAHLLTLFEQNPI